MHLNRDFNFKVKSVSSSGDDGVFAGLAAVYNNVDLGGDKILPGAFTRTIAANKSFPVLWQHQRENPIGTCVVTDSREGLQVTGTLFLKDPVAMRAFNLLKAGVIKGLSIGYSTIQQNQDGDIRELVEIKLYEVSCVTFAMNESAAVASVKAMTQDEITRHVKNLVVHYKAAAQHLQSMKLSLKALGADDDDWADSDDDDSLDDDPSLMEGGDDDADGQDEMSKAFLIELQKLGESARALATA